MLVYEVGRELQNLINKFKFFLENPVYQIQQFGKELKNSFSELDLSKSIELKQSERDQKDIKYYYHFLLCCYTDDIKGCVASLQQLSEDFEVISIQTKFQNSFSSLPGLKKDLINITVLKNGKLISLLAPNETYNDFDNQIHSIIEAVAEVDITLILKLKCVGFHYLGVSFDLAKIYSKNCSKAPAPKILSQTKIELQDLQHLIGNKELIAIVPDTSLTNQLISKRLLDRLFQTIPIDANFAKMVLDFSDDKFRQLLFNVNIQTIISLLNKMIAIKEEGKENAFKNDKIIEAFLQQQGIKSKLSSNDNFWDEIIKYPNLIYEVFDKYKGDFVKIKSPQILRTIISSEILKDEYKLKCIDLHLNPGEYLSDATLREFEIVNKFKNTDNVLTIVEKYSKKDYITTMILLDKSCKFSSEKKLKSA